MIRAVFVDLSGVLVRNRLSDLYNKFEEKYGLSKATFRQVLHFLSLGPTTKVSLPEYLKTLSVPQTVWNEFVGQFHSSETINADLAAILHLAKQKGIKIIITSNNVTDIKPRLADFGAANLPDLIIASGDIGLTKPDPAFWQFALSETKKLCPDINPAAVLVIDDHPDNLSSAEDLGFQILSYMGDPTIIHETLRHHLAL